MHKQGSCTASHASVCLAACKRLSYFAAGMGTT